MNKPKLRKAVFFPAFTAVLASGIIGLANNELLVSWFKAAFNWAYVHLSWLYQLIVVTLFILCCVLMVSKAGGIRIGGEHAKPRHGFWTWFAMSLTGGIGASIVSSSIAQPVVFLESIWGELEGYQIVPGSTEAVLFAMGRSLHEWTFFPYAFYGIFAVSIAYVCFNKGKSVSLSSTLEPLIGPRASRPGIAAAIDAIAVLALALAIVGTLGTFIGLATTCFKNVYSIAPTPTLMFFIMVLTTVLYLCSSLSGVERGIRFFSRLNFWFYMFLLAVILLLSGSVIFSLDTVTSSIGYWLQHLPSWAFDTGIEGGAALIQEWTVYNWAFWMAFAPVTGVFLAQLSYGHTIRESLFVNWIMPSLFAILWFGVFGGCAMNWQLNGIVDLAAVIRQGGTYAGIWALLQNIPCGGILIPITLFIMLISFATSADNSITVISALCIRGRRIGDEAPHTVKITWGLVIGFLSFLLMAYASGSKGNDGVRYMVVTIGSLLSVYIVLHIASSVKMFFIDPHHTGASSAQTEESTSRTN